MTSAGFEPAPIKTTALTWLLRPLGQDVLKHNSGVTETVVFASHHGCIIFYFLTFGHSHTLTMIALTFTFEVHPRDPMVVPKRRRPPPSPSLCGMTQRNHHLATDRLHHNFGALWLFVAILALSALVLLAAFVPSFTSMNSPLLRKPAHALVHVAPTTFTSNVESSLDLPFGDSMYDVIILGRGPAGLSAALFAARSGLSVLVLGSATGALSQAVSLDNYPSWQQTASSSHDVDNIGVGGPGWLQETTMQAERRGATFAPPGLLATNIESSSSQNKEKQQLFIVHSQNSHSFKSRSIIIATGSSPRRMDLPNEDILWGQALHTCAICDGSQYAGRTVLVVGGGDAALDAALILSRRSKLVYLLHRKDGWRAKDASNIQSVEATDNIRIMRPYIVKKWVIGEHNYGKRALLKSVAVGKVGNPDTTSSDDTELSVDGVFIMIGSKPNSHFLLSSDLLLELSSDGHVTVDDKMMSTSHPGVFAAGEVADERYRQAIGM